jgi:DNA-binding XRE family transcriptional regulator
MARAHADLTQVELAKLVGCNQKNISGLETSDSAGSELTVQIAHTCRVSPLWLATNTGPMISQELPTDEVALVEAFQNADESGQQTILNVCAALSKK